MPERRQKQGEDSDADDAEDSARHDRGAHAEERGGDAGFEVSEERATRVADLLDSGESAAQAVRDRLVPECPPEDSADHVRGSRQAKEDERDQQVRDETEDRD